MGLMVSKHLSGGQRQTVGDGGAPNTCAPEWVRFPPAPTRWPATFFPALYQQSFLGCGLGVTGWTLGTGHVHRCGARRAPGSREVPPRTHRKGRKEQISKPPPL